MVEYIITIYMDDYFLSLNLTYDSHRYKRPNSIEI